jgi:hypothetical protein
VEGDLDRANDQAVAEGLDRRRGKEKFDFHADLPDAGRQQEHFI